MTMQPAEGSGSALSFPNLVRMFSWTMLAALLVFLVNNFLTFGAGLPGAGSVFSDSADTLSFLQAGLYPAGLVAAVIFVWQRPTTALRTDSNRISDINAFFIRAAFWAVFIVGVVDAAISFLRVEGLLDVFFNEQMVRDIGRSKFRGTYIHMPLVGLGILLACFTRTLGFTWLALLIVVAELAIVFMRFVFSYEQAFMADLVRFWYGALFLFASAYTLLEEGHVRVDVFYAGFKTRTKAIVNAVSTLFMGFTLCWTILIVGMGQKTSVINSPVLSFEVTQAGFGMYVKYMMAAFLGIFAISMMIQFVSYLLAAIADYRGEPGARIPEGGAAH